MRNAAGARRAGKGDYPESRRFRFTLRTIRRPRCLASSAGGDVVQADILLFRLYLEGSTSAVIFPINDELVAPGSMGSYTP